MKHLTEMVEQHKRGNANGIYAVCSAHPLVLEAAIRYASANQTPLLIEATSNQVDQFGGYTGMTPADFRGFVCQLADSLNFPQDALILGGDHLGPNRWQNLPARQAMANAEEKVKATADYITGSNEEDGVAKAIERFVLEGGEVC